MNDSWVNLQGWVGSDVTVRDTPSGRVATFRVGCTPRYLKNGAWTDASTSWYTVNAWRSLADNVAGSVHKGDPVTVHGKVRVDVWQREEQEASVRCVVDATVIGHDLSKGTSRFRRTPRAEPRPAAEEDPRVKALVHGAVEDHTQLDHEGEPRVPATGSGQPEEGGARPAA